ncbi:hypothetical protein FYJ24_01850 [Actinomycetaceae bacterium WB03_NA08]|uniref:Integral membrane protein n=1 Tax=Scrofimicrobium canadense TaxID=2652290 RepID=A0A6N7W2L2_9ACTO|nr:hypothetical protein [Scrofimicrobium canadense]MSS83525.1 hypothetical protein [Scrofimicrobium canadense]
MTESSPPADDRTVSFGLGRLVIALFWIVAVVVLALSLWGLARVTSIPIGSRLIAVLAGIVYLLAAIGMTHNGRRMRMMAWGALVTALVGPIITGLSGLGLPDAPTFYSAWANFGATFWFAPLVIPLIGIVWMWMSDPRRIVELSEGIR